MKHPLLFTQTFPLDKKRNNNNKWKFYNILLIKKLNLSTIRYYLESLRMTHVSILLFLMSCCFFLYFFHSFFLSLILFVLLYVVSHPIALWCHIIDRLLFEWKKHEFPVIKATEWNRLYTYPNVNEVDVWEKTDWPTDWLANKRNETLVINSHME